MTDRKNVEQRGFSLAPLAAGESLQQGLIQEARVRDEFRLGLLSSSGLKLSEAPEPGRSASGMPCRCREFR